MTLQCGERSPCRRGHITRPPAVGTLVRPDRRISCGVAFECSTDSVSAIVPEIDQHFVCSALDGDPAALRAVVDSLTPIVQARVTRALLRRHEMRARDLRQEVADFTQEVFAALFTSDCKALRAWDPQRGLSFSNFVGLLAQRRVASLLRVRRRNPIGGETLRDSDVDVGSEDARPVNLEAQIASRELLTQLLEELEADLSPRGLDLFQRLYANEQSVEEVCAQTGLSPNAVHQWRRRLGQSARRALDALTGQRRTSSAESRTAERIEAQQRSVK